MLNNRTKFLSNNIIKGALTLTLAGLMTRFLGFFYRIFLSSKIGAEGMGLYQMIFPIIGMCSSLSCHGISTVISKFSSEQKKYSLMPLLSGLALSIPLSALCTVLLVIFGEEISIYYLSEPRCTSLIKLCSISLIPSAVHTCVAAYFLGRKNTLIPSGIQLTEQFVRIFTAFFIFTFLADSHTDALSCSLIAISGLITGELTSFFLSLFAVRSHGKKEYSSRHFPERKYVRNYLLNLLTMSVPLTMTHMFSGFLHSLEATAIPYYLVMYGMSKSDALSIYGTLTAMALPFIMFPNTLSGSVAKVLLPAISSSHYHNDTKKIHMLTTKTLSFCTACGLLCTLFFLLTGNLLGTLFFKSSLAGDFITTLSWLCPLMFTSTAFDSILNGLGMTKTTFWQNLISAFIRLFFIVLAVPAHGIKGYMWGLLAGEFSCTILHIISVYLWLGASKKQETD